MLEKELTQDESGVLSLIADEYVRAAIKFKPMNSAHEGYAVIKEEVDELWDAVKHNKTTPRIEALKEAIQIAAMALKYVTSLATMHDHVDLRTYNRNKNLEAGFVEAPKTPTRA